MMIPLVKVKQQQQILREEYEIPYQNYGEVEDQPAHSVMQLYLSDWVLSLLQNSTPCGQTAGGDRAPRRGA